MTHPNVSSRYQEKVVNIVGSFTDLICENKKESKTDGIQGGKVIWHFVYHGLTHIVGCNPIGINIWHMQMSTQDIKRKKSILYVPTYMDLIYENKKESKDLWDKFVKNKFVGQNQLLNICALESPDPTQKIKFNRKKADIWQVRMPLACCVWHLGRGETRY